MNAAELVAVLRTEHHDFDGWCSACAERSPCAPAIAADRIEAAYAVPGWRASGIYGSIAVRQADLHDALDGAS